MHGECLSFKDDCTRQELRMNAAECSCSHIDGCVQVYDTLTKDVFTPSHKNGDMMVLSNAQRLAAGCISGASACVVVFPLETMRTQAAMGQRHMKGAGAYFGLAADIIRCWPHAEMCTLSFYRSMKQCILFF